MFSLRDLVQWDRFITPAIIKVCYWLMVVLVALYSIAEIVSGILLMPVQILAGVTTIAGGLLLLIAGVVFARVVTEYVLIMFRIDEHLEVIRRRAEM